MVFLARLIKGIVSSGSKRFLSFIFSNVFLTPGNFSSSLSKSDHKDPIEMNKLEKTDIKCLHIRRQTK